jgi:hypothetical protein
MRSQCVLNRSSNIFQSMKIELLYVGPFAASNNMATTTNKVKSAMNGWSPWLIMEPLLTMDQTYKNKLTYTSFRLLSHVHSNTKYQTLTSLS